MSAPLDLLAGVVAQEAAALAGTGVVPTGHSRASTSTMSTMSTAAPARGARGVRKARRTPKATLDEASDDPAADSKRALRAERNRQSAAASRDRKKQHLRELENRVRYLSELATSLQYKAHVDSKEWRDKQAAYEAENSRLVARLAAAHADNEALRAQVSEMKGRVEGGGSATAGEKVEDAEMTSLKTSKDTTSQ